jgi:hypothetical protein
MAPEGFEMAQNGGNGAAGSQSPGGRIDQAKSV